MRNIAVIGAGQSGLLLAIGLLTDGHRVTLVSDRTADEIRHGRIPAGAVVFNDALQIERDLGIAFWDGKAEAARAVRMEMVGPDGRIALHVEALLEKPALCVDQRLKCFRWIEEFERRGGRLIVKPATIADLEGYARDHDLVVVAAGKGELSRLFARDDERSSFQEPPRHIAMITVTGFKGWESFKVPGARFVIFPGLGEIFSGPLYAKDEVQAQFVGFEAIPGSPMDRFTPGMSSAAMFEVGKQILQDFLPWDHEAIAHTQLVDDHACLFGKIIPTVRKPVAVLPSGAPVMGTADMVVLHDPIAAQGANNAAKMAHVVRKRITKHGDQPFDPAWMTDVFEECWRGAVHGNQLAGMLLMPPPPHAMEIFFSAATNPVVASRFLNGFNHPADLFPWFVDPVEARRYLASVTP